VVQLLFLCHRQNQVGGNRRSEVRMKLAEMKASPVDKRLLVLG
jgi:hypothetical protein